MLALIDALLGKKENGLNDPLAHNTPGKTAPSSENAELGALSLAPGRAASLPLDAAAEPGFAAIALRDRVVIMLLFDQVVQEAEVELAWQLWQQMSQEGVKEPLWRVLTLFPELDRELIYAEAARVYGFERARLSRVHALPLIHAMALHVEAETWERLVALRVLPIYEAEQTNSLQTRFVFATHDPTRTEVHQLLETVRPDGFELRYAPEGEIINLLVEAFPQRYAHLKGLSSVSKNFLAGSSYDELEPSLAPGEALPEQMRAEALAFFEASLADAVHAGATDLCILPTPHGETEAYVQIGETLWRQRTAPELPGRAVVEIVTQEVIHAEACGDGRIQKRVIQRIIDETPMHFRVSSVPASEEVHAACIVVRLVD